MFQLLYQCYRLADAYVLAAFLSYYMYLLCGPKKESCRAWEYLLTGLGCFALPYLVLEFFCGSILLLNSTYWIFIVCLGLSGLGCSWALLKLSLPGKATYILFFLTLIQLYKIVCSPLYEQEFVMPSRLYALLDLATGMLFYVLLFLMSLLFRNHRLPQGVSIMPRRFYLALYFPLSVLLSTVILANSPQLWSRYAPILAAIVLTNLPIIYYFFISIAQSWNRQRRLDLALQETQAQLSQYRYSIALQAEIRKERHELKNNYFYIQTLVSEGKYDRLAAYMDQVIGQKLDSLSEIQTGNTLMDYILNQKAREAREKSIPFHAEITIPAQLTVNEEALCTILLNLLDNAIEASSAEAAPDIRVDIHCVQGYLACQVRNRVSRDVLAENPQLRTTKTDVGSHGFGTQIIREAAQRNNGMASYDCQEGYFRGTVMLPVGSCGSPANASASGGVGG